MHKQSCRACKKQADEIFTGQLIKLAVKYYECQHCGYVQTEDPYWLDQAYSNAINDSDTGILLRNQANQRVVLATLFMLGKLKEHVVDYAGGYGILVRLLRDAGVDAVWSDRYCKNLLARGLEYTGEQAALVTAFEAFEHFVEPQQELEQMLSIAPNVLLSTEIIPNPPPNHDNWWYYGKEHGQHIGFFRTKTLESMAKRLNKNFLSDGRSYHLITDKKFSRTSWILAKRLAIRFPKAFQIGLTSKTWNDHIQNSGAAD